jgi:hypothetical protein
MDDPVQCKKQPLLTWHLKLFIALEVTDIIYLTLHCLHSNLRSASLLPSQLTTFVAYQSLKVMLLCLNTKHLH